MPCAGTYSHASRRLSIERLGKCQKDEAAVILFRHSSCVETRRLFTQSIELMGCRHALRLVRPSSPIPSTFPLLQAWSAPLPAFIFVTLCRCSAAMLQRRVRVMA